MPAPLFVVAAAIPATSDPWLDQGVVARVRVDCDDVATREELHREVADRGDSRVDDRDDQPGRAVAEIPRLRHPDGAEVLLP
jgi:hypothetical protein